MSNLVYPTLKGLDIAIKRSEVFATIVQTAASGKEQRASLQGTPRYRWDLKYNFLRQMGYSGREAFDELQTLNHFAAVHRGKCDSFLFADPMDSAVAGMGFGAGDGSTVTFQLQRVRMGKVYDALGTWDPHSIPRTNLLTYSQQYDNAAWTKASVTVTPNAGIAPDGTPTADLIQSGAVAWPYLFETASVSLGQPYTLSLYIMAGTSTKSALRVYDSSRSVEIGTAAWNWAGGVPTLASAGGAITRTAITDAKNGWYRLELTFASAVYAAVATLLYADFTGASSQGNAYFWHSQLEPGSVATQPIVTTGAAVTDTPAYYPANGDAFEPITDPMPGIVIARVDWQGPATMYPFPRSNSWLQSVALGTSPNAVSAATIAAAGGVIAPDGSTTAFKLAEDSTTASHFLYQGITTAAEVRTLTVYLKAAERSRAIVALSGSVVANINLATGAAGATGGGAVATATLRADGWVKVVITGLVTAGTTFSGIYTATADGTTASYAGTTGNGIYVWHPQNEPGNIGTSDLPTTTTAVTRTDFTMGSNGALTFAVAPPSGTYLTWTGGYYRRVRFDNDELELERLAALAWSGKSVKLISIK